jgi:alpha-ketoglutarate-dependent 2,4-dichlorophenoxyacetate dioxygenase
MQVRQLHPLFAAEIIGLDTSRPLSPESIAAVEQAMATYAVCVVRDASLNDADHIRFSRAFGPLELPPGSRGRIAPELYDISNLDAKGEIIPFDPNAKAQPIDFERFHTDSPFNSQPTKWSFLLAYVVPPEGADTLIADTRAAYEDLPQAMKDRIEGLVAVHDMFRALERTGVQFGDDKMRSMFPAMPHPLVRTSASGRKTLYLGWHAVGIEGWPDDEAQALLDELFQFAIQDKYIYAHKWRQGDMLIWDNRCTMHSATSFERYRYKRDCRRTTNNEYGPERVGIEGMAAPAAAPAAAR